LTLVLLKASATVLKMRTLLVLALAFVSAQVIAAQAPGSLPSLMLPLPPGSETSVASAMMLPRDVVVVTVAGSTGEHSAARLTGFKSHTGDQDYVMVTCQALLSIAGVLVK
jgi:hypothetical protein